MQDRQEAPSPSPDALVRRKRESNLRSGSVPPALVGLRVYLGAIFLIAVVPKLMGRPDFSLRLSGFLDAVALKQGHTFYQVFVREVVISHLSGFATLVMAAELTVGLLLVLGAATRLAASIAILLLINYMLAKGMWPWMPASNDGALIAIALALLVTRAGRTLGVDSHLAWRWPRMPLW